MGLMDEHTFDHEVQSFGGEFDGRCYDYGEMLDELRCHASESVELVRLEAVAEQRWWHLRELAALRVLDDLVAEYAAAGAYTLLRIDARPWLRGDHLKLARRYAAFGFLPGAGAGTYPDTRHCHASIVLLPS